MRSDWQSDVRRFVARGGVPATYALIAFNVVTWLLDTAAPGASPARFLAFGSGSWPLPLPWTVVTWPLVGAGHPLNLLFGCMWAFFIGGSLERSWGTRTFAGFFAAVSALTAVTYWIGGTLFHVPVGLVGIWHALAAPTVAWALMNRRQTVMINFFIPVQAIWLGYLAMIVLWYETGAPFLGLFALSGCAAAWWYVTKGRGRYSAFVTRFGGDKRTTTASNSRFQDFDREVRGGPKSARNPLDVVAWWRERQEKQRRDRKLEDMFRRSGYDDKDEKRR